MLNLPAKTEVSKQLPKKLLYEKFNIVGTERVKLDVDIKRLQIINELSSRTLNIMAHEEVPAIFVMLVRLKDKDFSEATLVKLSKLIEQKLLLLLECDGEYKIAVYYTKLLQTSWQREENLQLTLQGLNLKNVWEGFIKQIGEIVISQERSLTEQIKVDDTLAKLQKQIEQLRKKAFAEKQPRKKLELSKKIKELQQQMGELT